MTVWRSAQRTGFRRKLNCDSVRAHIESSATRLAGLVNFDRDKKAGFAGIPCSAEFVYGQSSGASSTMVLSVHTKSRNSSI